MMNRKFKRMVVLLFSVLLFLTVCLFLYTYRWNIINPNKSGSIQIDDLNRTFVYHVPKKLKSNPRLIIVYHGSNINAQVMQIFTGHEFDILADNEQNTIIVYPNGYGKSWNDYRKYSPYPAKQKKVDDITFTEKLIAYFQEKYQIDTKEIFAVGYSNGGQMVNRLANQKPGWFKGFATICASLTPEAERENWQVQQPVSIIQFNGKKDKIIPYYGGDVVNQGKKIGSVLPAEETFMHFKKSINADSMAPEIVTFKNESQVTTATQTTYKSNSQNKKVSFVILNDGGHTISNKNFRIPIKALGAMNKEVDAPELIWNFFKTL